MIRIRCTFDVHLIYIRFPYKTNVNRSKILFEIKVCFTEFTPNFINFAGKTTDSQTVVKLGCTTNLSF